MLNIAIDGTSASGKSTVSNLLAKKLNILHLNTGALYRCVAIFFLERKIKIEKPEDATKYLDKIKIDILFDDNKNQHTFLNNINITNQLNDDRVASLSSILSQNIKVREKIKLIQIKLAKSKDILIEGRDIGSEILPNADFKFYITATLEERANRRYKQLVKDKNITYEDILNSLKQRDFLDMNRKVCPLIKAKDAILVDTTNMSINETVEYMYNIVKGV